MNKAFIFPGQGSQMLSMGKDVFDNFKVAKNTFELIDDILEYKLSNIMFNGPESELTLTKNTQPALMAVSVAIVKVILDELGLNDISSLCKYVAGHSLGEYSGLCAADGIDVETTTKLLKIRANSMDDAAKKSDGAMAACIGIAMEELENIIDRINNEEIGGCCIANDNMDGQIVISGNLGSIDRTVAILKDMGFKAIKLKVSGAFHSSLMGSAENVMKEALSKANISKPVVSLISNITAAPTLDAETIRLNLANQICGRVRWRETINYLVEFGCREFVEIGSGNVLSGMLKRSKYASKLNIINISDTNGIKAFLASQK